ncbi:MAG: hypothetical protein ACREME_01450, partial [Gemmatimonadales bacterium]
MNAPRIERLLPVLAALSGTTLRVWQSDGRRLRPLDMRGASSPPPVPPPPTDGADWAPAPNGGGPLDTPDGPAWFQPVDDVAGVWLEIRRAGGTDGQDAADLAEIVG